MRRVTIRDIEAEFGWAVSRYRVRSAILRLGLRPELVRGPGQIRGELTLTPAEGDKVRAYLATRTAPKGRRIPRTPGYRVSNRTRLSEADKPEFAPVPLGGSGIEVPAHAVAELMRRREKFHAAGCVYRGDR